MSYDAESSRAADLQRAFDHLAALAAEADISKAQTPLAAWVAVLRHLMKRYGDVGQAPQVEGVSVTPVVADGVPAEWVRAAHSSDDQRLVYLHGGGWVAGAPEDYRDITAILAQLTGASILVPDYRLAPEHPFPAGLDDCARALAWAATHGPGGEGPAARLTVAGDSAGANLAAAAVIDAIQHGGRVPERLALIAGTLDNLPHADRFRLDDAVGTADSLAAGIATYLAPGDVAHDPRVSPVFAPAEVLAKFPPTLLQASSAETLLYDTRKFAGRLEAAGVRTALSVWPGLPHVWHAFLGLYPDAVEALAEIADFLHPRPRAL